MENCQRSVKPVKRLPAALLVQVLVQVQVQVLVQVLEQVQVLVLVQVLEPTKALNRRRHRHIRKELL